MWMGWEEGEMVGYLTCQARGLGPLPGGNGELMKMRKTGSLACRECNLSACVRRGNDSGWYV